MVAQRSGNAGEQAGAWVRRTPPLWLTVPARPGQLPGLRRALREWMVQAGIGDNDANAVQIAVGEATGNAVEHAYVGDEGGLVRLTARVDDGLLAVEVIDSGRWRPPPDGEGYDNRGRGIALMKATMDQVHIRRHDDGTTVEMLLALNGSDS